MGKCILLVEDEGIIAMHAEDILLDLGHEVLGPASGVAEALGLIAARRPDAAILDLNLGGETSEAIADELRTLGVPFALATGYDLHLESRFQGTPVLQKPYTALGISALLAQTFA